MYNRYNGLNGKVERVREKGDSFGPERSGRPDGPGKAPQSGGMPHRSCASPCGRKPGLMEQLGSLIPRALGELETEDIILLLILYLMYRDSGDRELLIIMGAMFLL